MLNSLIRLVISVCILFWVCAFLWISSIITLPLLYNSNMNKDYNNITGVSSTAFFNRDNHSNFYAINFLYTKVQYFLSFLIFSFDEFRQKNRIFSWIFSDSFLQWKKNLQQKTTHHDVWNRIIVSSIIATSSLYRYIKEILVTAYILYYFNPDILSDFFTIFCKAIVPTWGDANLPELESLATAAPWLEEVSSHEKRSTSVMVVVQEGRGLAWKFDCVYGVIPADTLDHWNRSCRHSNGCKRCHLHGGEYNTEQRSSLDQRKSAEGRNVPPVRYSGVRAGLVGHFAFSETVDTVKPQSGDESADEGIDGGRRNDQNSGVNKKKKKKRKK